MNIGVMTFGSANNYGAVLQAYSLQMYLRAQGHDCELIDYRCPAIEAMHQLKPIGFGISPRTQVRNAVYNVVFYLRRLRFQQFRRKLYRSRPYTPETIQQANGIYDLYLTGSDQVFNLALTKGDTSYFLDFAREGKKVAYAGSFGKYDEDRQDAYRRLLSSFDMISLREAVHQEKLQELMGRPCDIVADPIFLHTSEEWKKLLQLPEKKNDYILVYALIEDKALYQAAQKLAAKTGLKVIVMTKYLRPLGKADQFIRNASPQRFLSLIANAACVITNSFHGTAFSVLFGKKFFSLLPQAAPERIQGLLSELDLEDRVLHADSDLDHLNIDYTYAHKKIEAWRQKSFRFLCEATEK